MTKIECRHWGHAGAGILPYAGVPWNTHYVLLALRSRKVQEPFTWSTLGGAVRERETPWMAAVREAREECQGLGHVLLRLEEPEASHVWRCPECGWTYTTYAVRVGHSVFPSVHPRGDETVNVAWVPVDRVGTRKGLHPGLRRSWPQLRKATKALSYPRGTA